MALRTPASSSTTMTTAASFLFNTVLLRRQANMETGPVGRHRPRVDGTAMRLHDGTADGGLDAGSGLFRRRERIEQAVLDAGCDARPVVADADFEVTGAVEGSGQFH